MVGYSVHDIDYLRLPDIDYPPVRDIDYPLVRAPVDSDEVAVLIATPNLCLDRTEMVSAIVPGGVMRARSVEVTAGGKGVNVARVLRSFGQHPPIVGLVAERNGAELLELLAGEGATVVPVPTPGWVRLAIVMIEQDIDRISVLNEPGPLISEPVWADYKDKVRTRLGGQRLLVCSGSLPPGVPLDGYGQFVELADRAGVLSIVDTAPKPLAASLPYGPGLVTPNLEEAEAALSGDVGDVLHASDADVPGRAAAAALELCRRGAKRAAVTAGAEGIAFAEAESGAAQWFPAIEVDVVSAVGAGDSFVGGLAVELLSLPELPPTGDQWAAAIHRAIATAAASCEQLRAGGVDPQRVAELLEKVS
ncbi:MAG TPA: PfkB family carbohydrate kinase [Pseudonocardiaceae bacterium]|nr:PfkB family carbohydrate kinase [Pseudonocardiaceae bacterium]